jgi:hypothetical protein
MKYSQRPLGSNAGERSSLMSPETVALLPDSTSWTRTCVMNDPPGRV